MIDSACRRPEILLGRVWKRPDDGKLANLSEECDYLLTLFNPTDEKYGLDVHFGNVLSDYPNYRSIHLVESRDTECPMHLAVQMYGNIKHFKPI